MRFLPILLLMLLVSAPCAADETSPSPEFRAVLEKAQKGDGAAAFDLFKRYNTGDGVRQDAKAAQKWLEKAIDENNLDAILTASEMYSRADDATSRNEELFLTRKAADLGNAPAQRWMGEKYTVGVRLPRDDAAALALYRKAADQGYEPGMVDVGSAYQDGRGARQDLAEARRWFSKTMMACFTQPEAADIKDIDDGRPAPPAQQDAMLLWAVNAAREIMTYSADNAEMHFHHDVARLFADEGFDTFTKAVAQERVVDPTDLSSLLISSGPAEVTRYGKRGGAEIWQIHLPVTQYAVTAKHEVRGVQLMVLMVIERAPGKQAEPKIRLWSYLERTPCFYRKSTLPNNPQLPAPREAPGQM